MAPALREREHLTSPRTLWCVCVYVHVWVSVIWKKQDMFFHVHANMCVFLRVITARYYFMLEERQPMLSD